MKTFKQFISEDAGAPANSMGAAGISGLGPSTGGVAGIDTIMGGGLSMLRRKPPAMFAGKAVFNIPADKYHEASIKGGKGRYDRYSRWGDKDGSLAAYAKENPGTPIIVSDERTGALTYLRHGKKK